MIPHSCFGLYMNSIKIYTRQLNIFSNIYSSQVSKYVLYNASQHFSLPKRHLTIMPQAHQKSKGTKMLMTQALFENKYKNKETFLEAINKYKERERQLRGHIEFIYAAMNYLEEFGVERELDIYKSLLDIMPKGTMIPTSMFQEEFYHYPKHQDCALDLLDKMESFGVMPDSEVYNILVNTFGKKGRPCLKVQRALYWLPKFKYACPWVLPSDLPNDPLELAKLALIQINSVDPASKITVLQTTDIEDSIDDTWIVSAISPTQQELLEQHPKTQSLKVEGPFGVFLHDQRILYFVLRADPKPIKPKPKHSEIDDVKSIFVWVSGEGSEKEKELIKVRSVHEQADGTIMATCATGSSSHDSLLSWIRLLENSNPAIADIPVLFTQSSPIGDIITTSHDQKDGVDPSTPQQTPSPPTKEV